MSANSNLERWVQISPGTTRPMGIEQPEEGVLMGYAGVMVEFPIVCQDGKPVIFVPAGDHLGDELWERIIPLVREVAEEAHT